MFVSRFQKNLVILYQSGETQILYFINALGAFHLELNPIMSTVYYVHLAIIKAKLYNFRHCVCRRNMLGYSTLSADNLSCDPGDICEKNSDCGRDKWNRKGKCVITKRPNEDGNFEFGDIKMSGSHYKNKHGNWKKHK